MADKNFIVKNGLTVGSTERISSAGVITGTAATQSVGNSSTLLATTAYVRGEIDALIDSAPGTLNTLDELATALGDDANFSTTITNSIATKLPLAGGTMTGALVLNAALQGGASNFDIYQTTSDGSDNRRTRIGGGGDVSQGRGAFIELHGNEHSNTGDLILNAGDVSGGDILFKTDNTTRVFVDRDGKVLVGQTSAGTNGTLQVTGGIGLTGTSVIRLQSNADDSNSLKYFGHQFVAGQNNSHQYGYSGGGLVASVSPNNAAITLDVGAVNTSGHRLKVINAGNGIDGSLQYLDGSTVRFHVDSTTGIIKENSIPVRSRAIAMAMVFG